MLVSHGDFCHELKKSTEMIMGPQEDIISVGLLPSEGADDFKVKFLEAIDGLEDFTVFADLMGGTPCNVVSRLILEGAHFDLYAGMNMPMVIGFLNSQLLGEAVDYKEFAIENTHKVNDLLMAFADDDED
ncbi:PTS fructose transporter subunit IIA [Streptococcus iniae]|uniref:PTS sugar transporter subunit IIA n=1 Tax=Streptococcus iniae TaxID=1346 RepID=UPI000EF7800B|nr:PTS fructose transporter subunit IIA [Streptococcus iniae]RLV40561.1 PTS fructose transporter subunit IIA [Streptococcus iniae]RLV41452.1 PTS fructose transporter subunit IIA [Streptococcus iniae]